MALGKNIKVDKLIPGSEEEVSIEKKLETPVEEISVSEKENPLKEPITDVVEEPQDVRIIVEPSRRKSVKKAKVYIEGKLSVSNAEFITKKIKEVIAAYNVIDFKIRDVEEFDLSSVQVLYYFTNLYNKGKKTITFHIDGLPMNLKALLVKTKYNKILFKKTTT